MAAERFISIGASTGETTVDLQRVVMVQLNMSAGVVVLTMDVGPTITGHAGDHAQEVYRTLVDAWKQWLTRDTAQ